MENLSTSVSTSEKLARFQRLLRTKGIDSSGQLIPRRNHSGPCPLSFAQERLWFMNQLEPNNAAYNVGSVLRLKGSLNIEILEQGFAEIVRRHEILRTTFPSIDGQPMQVIAPPSPVKIPVIDLGGISVEEREAEASRLSEEDAKRSFDLGQGPLWRISLLRLGPEEHIRLFKLHHIISDNWSIRILRRELWSLYEAFKIGKPSPLEELPIQYADYAVWQREHLLGEILDSHLRYWREQLAGAPALLELPADRPRPAVQTYRGGRQRLELSLDVTRRLKDLSQREGVTLFMLLLAAFKVLLCRYTRQEDIFIGTSIASRTRAETEALIGLFQNNLVLRTDLSGNPTFRDLLARVREVTLEAFAHQELPFEKLVEELKPERNLSYSPVFQVMMVLRNAPRTEREETGLEHQHVVAESKGAKFDLTLSFTDGPDEFVIIWADYNTDLFEASRIGRMLGHYKRLLEGVVADPGKRISELPLLTEAEREQVIVEWNTTAQEYSKDQCIHELFENQVERTPDGVALVFEDEQLSYRELNRRANQVAQYLIKRGVGHGEIVGLCAERSLEMAVGILGILKAGGAYVALDPQYPRARLEYIFNETQIGLLLTQERVLPHLASFKGELLCLDKDRGLFEQEPEINPNASTEPERPAYVVYTSGSTGSPKGVVSSHRGVVNYLSYITKTYNVNGNDIVLQIASVCFDASVRDLLGPLTVGARVVLIDNASFKSPIALLTKIEEQHITCLLSVVPTLLQALLEARSGAVSAYNCLRLILVSGEALNMSVCRKAGEVFSNALVVNQYGPTECTMTSTYYRVVKPEQERSIALVGRPIANSEIYILSEDLNPVPIGVNGEVHIGGVGLSPGYLNQFDLTGEKFIPNPFGIEAGGRLYKTGDLACYQADGNIEFLGRLDHQVKLRGFRVELGEIEAVLRGHASVKEAVVAAREDASGDKKLAAYVVSGSEPVSGNELREFLSERLPEYMVPSVFVFLEALPLTPNGKVDRRALPEPDKVHLTAESYVEPRTPIEAVIAGIWAEVLKVERVGIHDNFFERGGHSLRAAQVVARIGQVFGVELPLRGFFESPTVAGLSSALGTMGTVDTLEEIARTWLELEQLPTDEINARV